MNLQPQANQFMLACNTCLFNEMVMLLIFIELCCLQDAHHLIVDDCEIIVDYNRQQLMPGWIPRRLG